MKIFNLCQEIYRRYHKRETINDEMVYCLWESIADDIIEGKKGEERNQYAQLLAKMDAILQYGQFENLTQEQSFLYGGIWGSLNILSLMAKKRKEQLNCQELVEKYKDTTSYKFLEVVQNIPGVQNKELADMCDVTTARISQIAKVAEEDGLISVRPAGKEKYYYIRKGGETVYSIIRKTRNSLALYKASPDFKSLNFVSNEGIDYQIWDLVLGRRLNADVLFMPVIMDSLMRKMERNKQLNRKVFRFGGGNSDLWQQERNNLISSYVSSWVELEAVNTIEQPLSMV